MSWVQTSAVKPGYLRFSIYFTTVRQNLARYVKIGHRRFLPCSSQLFSLRAGVQFEYFCLNYRIFFKSRTGEMRNEHKNLVENAEGKRIFGRPARSWKDNIRMELMEIGWETVDGFIWLRIKTCGGFL
jgi:hypothetical protein